MTKAAIEERVRIDCAGEAVQQAGMAAARGARTVTLKAFPVTHSSSKLIPPTVTASGDRVFRYPSLWGPLTTTQFVCPLSGVSHC